MNKFLKVLLKILLVRGKKKKKKLDPIEFEILVFVCVYYPWPSPQPPKQSSLEKIKCPQKQVFKRQAMSANRASSVPLC